LANHTGNEFDAYRSTYKETVNDAISFSGFDVDFFTTAKAERLIRLLGEEIGDPQNLSILDVGCGVGTYHPLLRGRVGKISGVDTSSECLDEARLKNPDVSYAHYDGGALPFEQNHFDASFAICVMHHVPPAQWASFTSEMARVTKPGGIVVIFEHNPLNPLTRRAVNTCPFDADAVLLSKRQTLKYLRQAGLSAVRGRYILTIPAIKGPALVIDKLFGLLPFGAQYFAFGAAR
jgi:SAM-dependent methyltransferase